MPTHAQLKTVRQLPKAPTGTTDEFKRQIIAALTAAGVEVPLDDRRDAGPHTVLAVLDDQRGTVRLWCIPDGNLGEVDRGHLERVAGRCFGTAFTADLMPEQFPGALLVLVRTGVVRLAGTSDGHYLEYAEEFAAEGVELPSVDWAAIGGDVWGGRDAAAGFGPIELTHFYCVHLA